MLGIISVAQEGLEVTEKIIDLVDEWNTEATVANNISEIGQKVVEILLNVPGMTQAHSRDFYRATPIYTLIDGTVVKVYQNPLLIKHIFLTDKNDNMLFGGFVGWIHTKDLHKAIENIKRQFTEHPAAPEETESNLSN